MEAESRTVSPMVMPGRNNDMAYNDAKLVIAAMIQYVMTFLGMVKNLRSRGTRNCPTKKTPKAIAQCDNSPDVSIPLMTFIVVYRIIDPRTNVYNAALSEDEFMSVRRSYFRAFLLYSEHGRWGKRQFLMPRDVFAAL